MKKVAKFLLGFVVGLIVLVASLALLVLFRPELVLNSRTLEWGGALAREREVNIAWSKGSIEVQNISLLRKRVKLQLESFCWRGPATSELKSLCFRTIDLGAIVDFANVRPRVLEVNPAMLMGGDVQIEPAAKELPRAGQQAAHRPPRRLSLPEVEVPRLIREIAWRNVDLQVERAAIARARGAIRLSGGVAEDARRADFRVEASVREGLQTAQAVVTAENANWGSVTSGDAWKLGLTARGAARRRSAELRATLQQQGRGWDVTSVAHASDRTVGHQPRKADLRMTGRLTNGEWRARLDGGVAGVLEEVTRLSLAGCSLTLRERAADLSVAMDLDCPLEARLKLPRSLAVPKFEPPRLTQGRVVAHLQLSPDASRVSGDVAVNVLPLEMQGMRASAVLHANVDGPVAEFPAEWKVEGGVNFDLAVIEFERLVEILAETPWAVPAPLNVMRGRVESHINGSIGLKSGEVPIALNVRLDSPAQRMHFETRGALRYQELAHPSRKAHLDLAVLLTDVQLALPRLDWQAPPRFVPDGRISTEKEQKKPAKSWLTYNVAVRTAPGKQVRLLSNLSRAPVPLFIDLGISDSEPMKGRIQVANFPLQVFRRDAALKGLTVAFKPGLEAQPIDGTIEVVYTDYTIRILIAGTTAEPVIKLSSDPPLPHDQVLAVLLFGRPSEQLDPVQSESVGSASAALADRALSLASLYFLASTPIESLGYDPASGLFSAKIHLGEGASLNLGAQKGALAQVGIRKRLSRVWTLTTTVGRTAEQDDRTVTAFLEWNHRY